MLFQFLFLFLRLQNQTLYGVDLCLRLHEQALARANRNAFEVNRAQIFGFFFFPQQVSQLAHCLVLEQVDGRFARLLTAEWLRLQRLLLLLLGLAVH
jgi:hypothetical protein